MKKQSVTNIKQRKNNPYAKSPLGHVKSLTSTSRPDKLIQKLEAGAPEIFRTIDAADSVLTLMEDGGVSSFSGEDGKQLSKIAEIETARDEIRGIKEMLAKANTGTNRGDSSSEKLEELRTAFLQTEKYLTSVAEQLRLIEPVIKTWNAKTTKDGATSERYDKAIELGPSNEPLVTMHLFSEDITDIKGTIADAKEKLANTIAKRERRGRGLQTAKEEPVEEEVDVDETEVRPETNQMDPNDMKAQVLKAREEFRKKVTGE